MQPREIVLKIEDSAAVPPGKGDRFAGYAVIGLPFRSGHVLAFAPLSRFFRGDRIHIRMASKRCRRLDILFDSSARPGVLPVLRQ